MNRNRRTIELIVCTLMVLALGICFLSGCTASAAPAAGTSVSGVEDGVLTVAMECAYAPYNWAQSDDANGAVPIANSDAGNTPTAMT